jgi:GDP-D-mannose 3',5'-epimerase
MSKRVLVLGSGGFIGGALVEKLMTLGNWVVGVDVHEHEYGVKPSEFIKGDLRDFLFVKELFNSHAQHVSEIYQLAADMGGAGYIFSGDNDIEVMINSSTINLNVIRVVSEKMRESDSNGERWIPKTFFSSSACIYPQENQLNSTNPNCEESSAYPANPDSEYGWEKLFSERLFLAAKRNYGLDIRIGRFHNIYGPKCTWIGGREKSPAALCRKIAEASPNGTIEIWGDGEQTRSFLYIEDCLNAILALMERNFEGPVNIGSEEMVTINEMARLISRIAGKELDLIHSRGPLGVRGRNSHNELFNAKVGYDYKYSLAEGLKNTYFWVESEFYKHQKSNQK